MRTLRKNQIYLIEFVEKCSFYSRLCNIFYMTMDTSLPMPEGNKKRWLEIFAQRTIYPPPPTHPLIAETGNAPSLAAVAHPVPQIAPPIKNRAALRKRRWQRRASRTHPRSRRRALRGPPLEPFHRQPLPRLRGGGVRRRLQLEIRSFCPYRNFVPK
jgi:hypothetical protein